MTARVLALLVHALWALLLVTVAALLLSPTWWPLKAVLGLVLGAMAWQVRPRSMPLPAGTVLDRAQVPQLFALIDRVATATGTRAPKRVVVDVSARMRSGRAGGGTYVSVGLPLWSAAEPLARVAALAEQLGRLASRAAASDPLVVSAAQSLTEWQYFFTPQAQHRQRLMDSMALSDPLTVAHVRPAAGQSWLFEVLLAVVLLPFYVVVTVLRRALVAVAARDQQRADEGGRQTAARLVPEAATVLSRLSALAQSVQAQMESASRRDPKASLWDIGVTQRLAFAKTDLLSPEDADAIDAELRPLLRRAEQDLREAARA